MKPMFIKGYDAEAEVNPYRFVAYGTEEGTCQQAGAGEEKLLGLSDSLGADAGGTCDVIREGIGEVEYGGNVSYGDPLKPDADGKAVVAAAGEAYLCRAEESGDAGTIGKAYIERGRLAPAA